MEGRVEKKRISYMGKSTCLRAFSRKKDFLRTEGREGQ